MFRSIMMIIFVAVSQIGCCCCADFMKGFNKGFNEGMRKGQQQRQQFDDEQRRIDEENRRKAELQQLLNNLGPNNYAGTLAQGSPFWTNLRQIKPVKHNPIGGGREKPFSHVHPDGGVLVGFFAGTDNENQVVAFLQPIYLTKQAEKTGQAIGQPRGPVQVLKAKTGYAVSGAKIRMGAIMDAITLTFAKVDGERFNLGDRYDSPQVGGNGGGLETFTSPGTLLVGIHGMQNDQDGHSPAGSPNSLGFYSLP